MIRISKLYCDLCCRCFAWSIFQPFDVLVCRRTTWWLGHPSRCGQCPPTLAPHQTPLSLLSSLTLVSWAPVCISLLWKTDWKVRGIGIGRGELGNFQKVGTKYISVKMVCLELLSWDWVSVLDVVITCRSKVKVKQWKIAIPFEPVVRSRLMLGLGLPSSANGNCEWPLPVHWNCLFVNNQSAFNVSRICRSALIYPAMKSSWSHSYKMHCQHWYAYRYDWLTFLVYICEHWMRSCVVTEECYGSVSGEVRLEQSGKWLIVPWAWTGWCKYIYWIWWVSKSK